MPYPYASDADEIRSRLRKIEGQVRGIHRMVDEQAYCIDILTQVSAVISGMEKVGLRLLREHMRGCVSDAFENRENGEEKIEEVVRVVERFLSA